MKRNYFFDHLGAFDRSFSSVQEGLSSTCQSTGILPDDRTQPVLQFQSSTHEQQSMTNISFLTKHHSYC
jgi:hypothetical protein